MSLEYNYHMNKAKNQKWWMSVTAAVIGNTIIAIIKFLWFLASWSWSLFSEAIHSMADTSNQALLMIGVKRSGKQATETFSYGYKKERFLRALISACGIFFIWAGVTIYHGIANLWSPSEIHISQRTFIILAISCVIESITLGIAINEIKKSSTHRKRSLILEHADPITLAVVYEDTIAVAGVLIATIGLVFSYVTQNPLRDAITSIIIGVLLWCMAIILIDKNRKLLIGKSIPHEIKEEIIELMEKDEIIEKVLDFKSTMLDMDTYHIKCEIECNGTGLLKEINRNNFLKNEYEEVKESYADFLEFCIDYTRRVPRIIGTKIDEVEKKIKEKFPQVRHIDIEIN